MNTPVSFKIAIPLKEKGFDEICHNLWHFIGSNCIEMSNKNSETFSIGFSAPTIAEVVMWLYEKHNIWVYAHKEGGWWIPVIENYYDEDNQGTLIEDLSKMNNICFDSPKEAYEAAIEYTLKNLI